VDTYYIVSYTKTTLYASKAGTTSAGVYYMPEYAVFNITLGSDPQNRLPDEKAYWTDVRSLLSEAFRWRSDKLSSRVILVGDSVKDTHFRKALDEVLEAIHGKTPLPVVDNDPVFAQAKGIAELVRRSVYLPKGKRPEALAHSVEVNEFDIAQGRERMGGTILDL
jgi:hypothetical protein